MVSPRYLAATSLLEFVPVCKGDSVCASLEDGCLVKRASLGETGLSLGDIGLSLGDIGLSLGDIGLSLGDIGRSLGDIGLSLGAIGLPLGVTGLLCAGDRFSRH